MSALVLGLPGGERLAARLRRAFDGPAGALDVHRFPDGEVRVRIDGDPGGRDVVLVGSLDRPDEKVLPFLFAAGAARALHAREIGLVVPYLPYLRQDAVFRPGEAMSARLFADLISSTVDWLVTVDPHLHRTRDLRELFSIPAQAVHTGPLIADWIRRRIQRPMIVGPDEESGQWVARVAEAAGAPWVVMAKRRLGDRAVELTLPRMRDIAGREPVLVDDIVASGGTLRAASRLLASAGHPLRWAVAVHPVADPLTAASLAREARVELVSCNTIPHPTNRIDVSEILHAAVERQLSSGARALPAPAGR
jgi:ribose-phosphate pyrophosphokinase